jgi:hypothetical protein
MPGPAPVCGKTGPDWGGTGRCGGPPEAAATAASGAGPGREAREAREAAAGRGHVPQPRPCADSHPQGHPLHERRGLAPMCVCVCYWGEVRWCVPVPRPPSPTAALHRPTGLLCNGGGEARITGGPRPTGWAGDAAAPPGRDRWHGVPIPRRDGGVTVAPTDISPTSLDGGRPWGTGDGYAPCFHGEEGARKGPTKYISRRGPGENRPRLA